MLFCQCKQEMTFFDFLMTPDGGGSERLMGKYFHNMFVLRISSKHGAGGNKREWGSIPFTQFKTTKCKTFNFYSYSNLFSINIKQVYSPGPVAIDSALLFTCVKKQMALTYLMLGGKGGWQRVHASLVLCVFLVQASGILFALVLYCLSLLPFSLSLSRLSSASSQPRCRQEVRPCHSALPAMSTGSPSQITPPTVQYLKKSRILFV